MTRPHCPKCGGAVSVETSRGAHAERDGARDIAAHISCLTYVELHELWIIVDHETRK